MRRYRYYAAMLLAPVLVVGLALGTPRLGRADDAASTGRAILGALLAGAFDRDYPPGSITFGRGYGPGGRNGYYGYCARGYGCGDERPVWFYYPGAGVFAFPGSASPYPYGIRWWQFAGRYQQRLVFVPAMYQGWGNRETLRFPAQRPIFVLPSQQYASYPGYRGQGYGYGGQGYGYGGQGYGNGPGGFFQQSGWQPSPTLRSYRSPAKGWRRDWDPQRDGWYDLEARAWHQAPEADGGKVLGTGPGQKAKPPNGQIRRVAATRDSEDPTPGPAQKVKPEFDESWRSDMGGSREDGNAKP